jgi:hypothetical protein
MNACTRRVKIVDSDDSSKTNQSSNGKIETTYTTLVLSCTVLSTHLTMCHSPLRNFHQHGKQRFLQGETQVALGTQASIQFLLCLLLHEGEYAL